MWLVACCAAFALVSPAHAFAVTPTVRPRARLPTMQEVEQEEPSAAAPAAAPSTTGSGLSEAELAEQAAKLDALSAKWKRRREENEYVETLRSGWGPSPEIINGRAAMFFIVVGLVTEYYTGQSLPQQVQTMLQTLGFIG